jgi:glycosyltransferase involved in cell wall biosynthesis
MVRPRRVMIFRPSLGEGGADRVTTTLLRHLDRARFTPSLALMKRTGPFLADLPADVAVHEVGARRLATSVPRMTALLLRERPDVLFSTSRSKARLVLSERNAFMRGRARDLKLRLEVGLKRLTYRHAELVTAVSQGVADQLVRDLGLAEDKVSVVYNPMVEADIGERAAAAIDHPFYDGAAPVIVACARLVDQKGYPTLLEAFARVRAQRLVRLLVLGEGPLRPMLEQRAAELGIGEDVCFAGFHKNPFPFFARAQLLMHASKAEGLPGSLIQCMAVGTPVVSTDCDFGPREVITSSGRDGFLVPVGDDAALADRALRLLGDDDLRRAMAEAARASVTRFTTEASMARYTAAIAGAAA